MSEKKKTMVQTTLRVEQDILYDARHYLNLHGKSVAKFLQEKLEEIALAYRKEHPQEKPRPKD